ncbi:hypothetical protein SBA3_690011 [Candidatus Sulfopaludibacter sp. SbA3]|nr:hypothetical protein SBA3_690011 [Candidatus Sulfopaludibacter sp. SbA3]
MRFADFFHCLLQVVKDRLQWTVKVDWGSPAEAVLGGRECFWVSGEATIAGGPAGDFGERKTKLWS